MQVCDVCTCESMCASASYMDVMCVHVRLCECMYP